MQVTDNVSLGTRGLQIGTGQQSGLEAGIDALSPERDRNNLYAGADLDGAYAGYEHDLREITEKGDSITAAGTQWRAELQAGFDGELRGTAEYGYSSETTNSETGLTTETEYGFRYDTNDGSS